MNKQTKETGADRERFFDESEDGRDAELMLTFGEYPKSAAIQANAPRARQIWLAGIGIAGADREAYWLSFSRDPAPKNSAETTS